MVLTDRLSLGKRIALLLLLGLAIVLALFGFLSLRSVHETSDRALHERLITAQLTARHIDSFLTLYLDMLGRSAAVELMAPYDSDPSSGGWMLERLYMAGATEYQSVYLVNREREVIGGEPAVARSKPMDPPARAVAEEVLATDRRIVSDGYRGGHGELLVALGVPLHDGGQGLVGGMVVVLNLSDSLLDGFVQPASLGHTGYAEIVDSQGAVLASTNHARLFQKSDHTDQFAAMIKAGRPTVGACHSCHEIAGSSQPEPDILAFAPLSSAPWGVAIRQSEEEALAPARGLQRSLVIVSALSLLAAMGMVLLAQRSVVRPVLDLAEAARRIARGDLDSEVKTTGPAEIGQLAREFDRMREELRSCLAKLEQVKASLELRVDERTRQLSALLEVSKLLASTFDLRDLLQAVAARARDVLELADGGIIILYQERTGRLEVRSSWGYGDAINRLSFAPGEGACGRSYLEGESILLDSPEAVRETLATVSAENRAWLAQSRGESGVATSLMALPLIVKGRPIGAMMLKHHHGYRSFSKQDLRLAQALADQVALAIENIRLYQEVLEKERLRGELLDKVIVAQEEERRRIARELHDDTCQSLAALAISLEGMEESLTEPDAEARAGLSRLKGQVRSTLAGVRTLALNLRPSVLDDLGLIMAIDWYAKEQLVQRGVEVKLEFDGLQELPSSMETVLFRITQEALTNVVKHSGTRTATVRLAIHDSRVVLQVEDEGLGFDVERVLGPGGPRNSLGLHSMRERASLSGGVFRLFSSPGLGTKVQVELPLQRVGDDRNEEDICAHCG